MTQKIELYQILFFNFLCCLSFAQNEFVGALRVDDTLSITYRLVLSEANGKVTGYSVTDIGGDHETRSNVHGEYDKNSRELNFRETEVVYTKTPLEPDYEFCHVNYTTKGFQFGKTNSIKGKFMGLFDDYTECVSGELFLSSIEKVENKVQRVSKKINRMKRIPDSVKTKFNNIRLADSLKLNILRDKERLSFFSKSKAVKLILYDGGQEDGDVVTISCNGKVVLENHKISRKQEIIPIVLEKKINKITVIAVSTGTISANTAVIELQDDDNNIKALTNLKKGEMTLINIIKN